MSLSSDLDREIQNARKGKSGVIPIAYKRVCNYIDIAKNTMYSIAGETGVGKCLAEGTKVIMFSGQLKEVESIRVGDILMGPDSKPRSVLSITNGVDQLYEIKQNQGNNYKTNGAHILRLRNTWKKKMGKKTLPHQENIHYSKKKYEYFFGERETNYNEISVEEAIKQNKTFFHKWKGYKVGVDFEEKSISLDPYFVGLWLGDGSSAKPQITSADPEIVEYLNNFSEINNCEIVHPSRYIYNIKGKKVLKRILYNGEIITYSSITCAAESLGYTPSHIGDYLNRKKPTGKRVVESSKRPGLKSRIGVKMEESMWEWESRENIIWEKMKSYNLPDNKYIPDIFLYNSRENRLSLLAGLLDSDGYKHVDKNGYEIVLKSEVLAKQTTYLSRSLGFYTSINEKYASMKRKDGSVYRCLVYRIGIFGEGLEKIPCKLPRKRIIKNTTKISDSLSTGISIEKSEIGKYYGFTIDKDGLFLLEDFTVTHNSTLTVDMFLVNPIMWYLQNKNDNIKLSVIYLSMERKLYMTTSRIISRLIFEEQGIEIPPKKILGRNGDYQLTDAEYALVQQYYDRIDEWERDDVLICHEGSKNSSGIGLFLEKFAEKHGVITRKDMSDKNYDNILSKPKTYEPTHPNHIVLVITDHIGILTPEESSNKTKSTIDGFSKKMREARDVYGFSPVIVQQMNRNMSDVHRHRLGELKPKLSDIADSSNTAQDSDVVMVLHDPLRHNIEVKELGYDVQKFRDKFHRNFYRSLHILKNSFESSDVCFPFAVHPVYGMLSTLPMKQDIQETIYKEVLSGQYFLTGGTQESIEPQLEKKAFKLSKN